jgi:hypothetical protein
VLNENRVTKSVAVWPKPSPGPTQKGRVDWCQSSPSRSTAHPGRRQDINRSRTVVFSARLLMSPLAAPNPFPFRAHNHAPLINRLKKPSVRVNERMRFITCFGGGAAVADDSDEAAASAARRGSQKRWSLASSFRGKLLSSVGKKSKKTRKPSPADEETRDSESDSISGLASTASSSVPSSAPLSLSPASSPRPLSVSSSSAVLRAFPPRSPKRKARRAAFPVTGAAAFVLCLLMVVLCGKIGATLLTSTALYLLPRLESPAKKTKAVGKGFFGRNCKQ